MVFSPSVSSFVTRLTDEMRYIISLLAFMVGVADGLNREALSEARVFRIRVWIVNLICAVSAAGQIENCHLHNLDIVQLDVRNSVW
ncbi:hypothetical protein BKA82DRAFT_4049237 [Pisolithus tinctorius]|nr:hypothetical protein BKA82DRAFT_4049237 [Pisolithus tinctorius]